MAVDVGSVRVGVAVCDPDGILATPVETVRRAKDGSDIARLLEIIAEYEAIGVIIGLPRTLRGEEGPRCVLLGTSGASSRRSSTASPSSSTMSDSPR